MMLFGILLKGRLAFLCKLLLSEVFEVFKAIPVFLGQFEMKLVELFGRKDWMNRVLGKNAQLMEMLGGKLIFWKLQKLYFRVNFAQLLQGPLPS